MRFLSGLLVGLLALAVILVGVASLLPREITLTREIVIAAPAAAIFPHLAALQKAAEWSPWMGDAKPSFAGPQEGVGNRMTWSARDGSAASEEIITSVPNERVETALDLSELGIATSWQVLKPEGKGTRVTWGLLADTGAWPLGRYRGLLLARRIGADFDAGLARLKALVEAG